jgi:hypothetical protein
VRAFAPDGTEWVYEPGLAGEDGIYLPAEAELDVLDAILWLLGLIPRLLLRLLWDPPRAGLAALASDRWTVEAVSWYPQRTSHRWITQRRHRREVVAEVGRQIAAGRFPPKPRNATYTGEDR